MELIRFECPECEMNPKTEKWFWEEEVPIELIGTLGVAFHSNGHEGHPMKVIYQGVTYFPGG